MALDKEKKKSSGPTKVYIETKDAILNPVLLGPKQTYRDLFEANEDAQALWVLKAGMREPFRVPWRSIFQSRPAPHLKEARKATRKGDRGQL